ncbi:MAG TPA: anti-sigma factor [Gemmataceae bacterium]|nr:anti-sigma factor [Gemmataceae bacterium]
MTCQDMQHLMHGYFDHELDLVRNLEMEGHLQTCPACAQALANYRSLQGALRNDAFYFKAPDSLETRIRSSLRKTAYRTRPLPLRIWARVGAIAASILIVFALGWMATRGGVSTKDLLSREIVSSHVRSLMAMHLTDVPSSDQHTVKPWFKGQLDFSPPVKDLSKEDFALVGGRLDYIGDRPVAALVYQRRKHVINLFIWPSTPDSATNPPALTRQGYHLIRWTEGGLAYWAISDLNEKELEEFVQLVRK